jgi:hypothetical protein
MVNYLELYNEMVSGGVEKTATATEEVEQTAEAAEVDARMETIYKYASLADHFLAEEFGEDYAEEDVVKLAQMMIVDDLKKEEEAEQKEIAMQKVAEMYQLGRIAGRGFKDEVYNQ